MAVSILPRELKYTYGSFVVGGTSSPGNTRMPFGGFSIRESFGEAEVLFSFVISQTSEATFVAEAQAVEAAFRIPRQAFTITVGSTTLKSYSHVNGTGFDADPAATFAIDDQFGSARSRKYDVRIVFRLPATNMSTNARQSSVVKLEYDASNIKTLTITGAYTASSTNSARTMYESNFAAYASTVRTAFSSNFEQIGKMEVTPDTGTTDATPAYQTLTFEIRYREIIYSQAGAALNDSAVVGQKLDLRKSQSYPGDATGYNVRRLVRASANWSANIDKTVTTDLASKWTAVMPWVVTQVRSKLSLSSIAVSPTVVYNYDNNTISANLEIEGIDGGGFLEYMRTETIATTTGVIITPVTSGDPYDKFVDHGPATVRATVEESVVESGIASWGNVFSGISFSGGLSETIYSGLRDVLLGVPKISKRYETRGLPPNQFDVTVWSRTASFELLKEWTG